MVCTLCENDATCKHVDLSINYSGEGMKICANCEADVTLFCRVLKQKSHASFMRGFRQGKSIRKEPEVMQQ